MVQITPSGSKANATIRFGRDKNNQLQFGSYAQDGKLYQSEHQSGSDARNFSRYAMNWNGSLAPEKTAMAANQAGYSLVFKPPLSFFYSKQGVGLSPGYERGNLGFNRPISPAVFPVTAGARMRWQTATAV